jgi:hypothetical protein
MTPDRKQVYISQFSPFVVHKNKLAFSNIAYLLSGFKNGLLPLHALFCKHKIRKSQFELLNSSKRTFIVIEH